MFLLRRKSESKKKAEANRKTLQKIFRTVSDIADTEDECTAQLLTGAAIGVIYAEREHGCITKHQRDALCQMAAAVGDDRVHAIRKESDVQFIDIQ